MSSTVLNSQKSGAMGMDKKGCLDQSGNPANESKSESEEQIYLLEIIVESVKVEKEGILDEFKVEEDLVTTSTTAIAQPTESSALDPNFGEDQLQTQTVAQEAEAKRKAEALGATKVIMKFYEFPPIEITEKEYVTPMMPDSTNQSQAALGGEEVATTTAMTSEPFSPEPLGGVQIGGGIVGSPRPSLGELGNKQEESQLKIKHTTGKSCLFPMTPSKFIEVIKRNPLEIQLSRAAGKGPRAMPAHVIGQTRIHMEQKFIDTVTIAATPITLPISASIENKFDLKNVFGDTTAYIKLVIRLSCFGSNIFTQFNYVKGEQGFQFKTCSSAPGGKPGDDEKKNKEEEEKKFQGIAVDFGDEYPPEFTDDSNLGFLPQTPAAKKADAFKRAVPWRKLKDDVPLPKICGPKNLFTESQPPVKCPFQKDKAVFKMFPSLSFKPGVTNSLKPGNTMQQIVPQEFGNTVPPALKNLLPGQAGTFSGPIEAPPGMKFPCQFGSSWLPELNLETSKGVASTNRMLELSGPGKYVCTSNVDQQAPPMTGCSCTKKPLDDAPTPVRFQPGVANAPAFPRSPAPQKCMECECGLAERSNKNVTNQGPSTSGESKSGFPSSNPLDRVPCPFFKNEIKGMMQNPPKDSGQAFIQNPPSTGVYKQMPDSWNQQRMDTVGIGGCPAFMSPRQQQEEPVPTCGLSELATPEQQQSLKNLLAQPIMPPVCLADSTQKITSLCTCPKVATPEQRPNYGYIRCECTNIMSSMKPIDMPFSCGPPCPAKSNLPTGQQKRVQPVPINLPPPPPECPLAQLLQEAANAERKQPEQTQQPSSSQFGTSSQLPTTIGGAGSNQRVDKSQPLAQGGVKDKPETESSREDTRKGAKQKGKKKLIKTSSTELGQTNKPLEVIQTTDDIGDSGDDRNKPPKRSPEERAKALLKEEVQTYDEESSEQGSIDKIAKPTARKAKPKKQGGDDQKEQPVNQRASGLPPFVAEKDAEIAYTYTAGMYPGIHVGHKDCVPVYQLVPKNMGWLWNVRDGSGYLRPGRGWRPGSIQTQVMKVIDYVKKSEKENVKPNKGRGLGVAKAHSGKLKSQKEAGSQQQAPITDESKMAGGALMMGGGDGSATSPTDINTGPTLHLHKSHGVYYVSLYPPKKPIEKETLGRKGKKGLEKGKPEECEEDKPIQFRIDPKNPDDNEQGLDDIYETDDTSTDSADSYELEFVTPNTMAHRIVKPMKRNMEIQVTETELQPTGKKGPEVDNRSKTSLGSTQKSITKKKKQLRSSPTSAGSKRKGKDKNGKANKKK